MLPFNSEMSEIKNEKAETNNMDLKTSTETKYDFPLDSAENNSKVVTINDYENDNTDCETKDCENEDSSVSDPEYYYYYYYDYIDSDKETKDDSFEPLPHHL